MSGHMLLRLMFHKLSETAKKNSTLNICSVLKDTVGSTTLYSSIGGNGTDGEDSERYNGVGYNQH